MVQSRQIPLKYFCTVANKQREKQKHGAGNVNHEAWLGVCGHGSGDGVRVCLCAATTVTTTTDPYGPFTIGQKNPKALWVCECVQLLYSVLKHECVYVQNEQGDIYDQALS